MQDPSGTRTVYYRVQGPSVEVVKRYKDFVQLHSLLSAAFPAVILPPLPPKHSLSRLLTSPWGYKQDSEIIARRTRLLDHYLTRLLAIPFVGGCDIVANFLSGNDEMNDKIAQRMFSNKQRDHTDKSLLISPQPHNWDKMNPLWTQLPIPPMTYLNSFVSPNADVFRPLEALIRSIWACIGPMEMTVKSIRASLEAWRKQLVDLGGFLNIMSMNEDDFSLRKAIESFGNKIDLTFLNVEVLMNSINKSVLEFILIVKYSISEIVKVLHYRKLKECQLSFLQLRISKMQLKCKLILDKLVQNQILKTSNVNDIHSPSLTNALRNLNMARTSDDDEIPSVQDSNPETVKIVRKYNDELSKRQIPCYEQLKEDVKFVNDSVKSQSTDQLTYLCEVLVDLTQNWQKCWYEFGKAQAKVWSEESN